jgi:hypothetical protein
MHFHWFLLVIVFCAMPLTSPAGEKADNPLKKAKIGDYVAYKMIATLDGKDKEVSVKSTVSAKNDKELTAETAITYEFMGKTVNKTDKDTKIDLTKPYDQIGAIAHYLKEGKWEKTGDGKEKIKVGDKTYDCTWIYAKGVGDADGVKTEVKAKLWFDKSVPLWGLVKWEIKSNKINMRLEITGYGSAK